MGRFGKVYIVGAGPGCSGLISLRGLHILQRADCVLYDKLISGAMLRHTSANAEMVYVGKDVTEQHHINDTLVEKAAKHKIIARLKGGDPMIFGRTTEEIHTLAENGIDFEIIPGVTAASAAAACGGIVLTDRNTASSVTFVTGQMAEGKMINIDFKSLVKIKGTVVFYMAVGNMQKICQKFIKAGMVKETNAVVVANASLTNQKIVMGEICDIAKKCSEKDVEAPAVLIIGKKCVSLLADKTLFGKKIMMTRDSYGNEEMACKLAARGAEPVDCPMFEIQDLTGKKEFKQVVGKIKKFDWVFFTSPNGVRLFFNGIKRLKMDSRVFADSKIACMGSETANALEEFGMMPDFVPKNFTSKDLTKEFIRKYKPRGTKILLLRSGLAEKLEIEGAMVENFAVYTAKNLNSCFYDFSTSSALRTPVEMTRNASSDSVALPLNGIDWITFASSFAVKCFFEKFNVQDIRKIKIASIGPMTTETLKSFGIAPTVEAEEHTIDGLIAAMEGLR